MKKCKLYPSSQKKFTLAMENRFIYIYVSYLQQNLNNHVHNIINAIKIAKIWNIKPNKRNYVEGSPITT